MAGGKAKEDWEGLSLLDLGELNKLNSDVFESRYDDGQPFATTLSEIFAKHYSYDVMSGTGPYAAVVLEVLSGPQVKNEGKTKFRANTTSLNIDEYPFPFFKQLRDANKATPVIVKAKIPEFDVDIDWPRDKEDKARIDAHGEYYQFRQDEDLSQIKVGSIIWVSFNNSQSMVSKDGNPVGKIIGIQSIGTIGDIEKKISAQKAMNPDCQASVNRTAPAGGLYVGHTDPDPGSGLGHMLPLDKIKSNIKTGMYGNGTPQTKAHFNQALLKSETSFKHKIPGGAPGSNNAFIWIGNLKNNGYLDVLDRPISVGRETIIYAPMTLDLTAPIEIKYYFHDRAGFGHAHLDGPDTKIERAIQHVDFDDNDFRCKIGPAIKDLNKDGRNYVLVVPEMSYSRGFGTKNGNITRIKNLKEGKDASSGGNSHGETIRTKMNSEMRTEIKNYLASIPIELGKNLLHITPLREREFATFDGSFTGGKFGDFHQEVLDVLNEHLGTIQDKIFDGMISFVADNLGSVALSSIVKDVIASETHDQARTSFKNLLTAKSVRIDYITDENIDSLGSYGYFFNGSPSFAMYEDFLLEKSEVGQGYTEFNYITRPTQKQNFLFNKLEKSEQFSKNAKSASGIGKRKFSFNTIANAPESFISLHVSPADSKNKKNAVGYAFSMINDWHKSYAGPIVKPNSNSALKPSYNSVPNHAYALSTRPSVGDLERIFRKKAELEERMSYFEDLINSIQNGQSVCDDARYSFVCDENGVVQTHTKSLFFSTYLKFLDDKKSYLEIINLEFYEREIQKILNKKNDLIKLKNEVSKTLKFIEKQASTRDASNMTWLDTWNNLRTGAWNIAAVQAGLGPTHEEGYIATVASIVTGVETYKKILSKIEKAIKDVEPDKVEKPKDCAPQPEKLGNPTEDRLLGQSKPKTVEPGNNCSQINVSTPNTFDELTRMIGYFPEKSDFSFSGRSSKTKTKIHDVAGFKTSTFKYAARAINSEITHKTSLPMWACITEQLEKGWKEACQATQYYPFEITSGIRGLQNPPTKGTTAYRAGMSLHSFGLAFDLDPFIAGYSRGGKPVYSVYTGAWTPGFIEKWADDLYELGVYKDKPSKLIKNAYEDDNRPRLAHNWQQAPSRYKGGGESGGARQKYVKIMNSAKGSPIVPLGANPTLWIIEFCERTGMKWGNGYFLKKRWRGGRSWNSAEKSTISVIFDIPNVVDRINAISWNSRIEDHMHIHYWGNKSLILWNEINKVTKTKK